MSKPGTIPDHSPEGKLRKAKAFISQARAEYIKNEDETSGDMAREINNSIDELIAASSPPVTSR